MEPVNLINEEDVALLDIGEDAREITRFLDLRAGSGVKLGTRRARDQIGKGRFTESGRTGEQDMIKDISAPFRRFQHEQDPVLDLLLADEFRESRRTQR